MGCWIRRKCEWKCFYWFWGGRLGREMGKMEGRKMGKVEGLDEKREIIVEPGLFSTLPHWSKRNASHSKLPRLWKKSRTCLHQSRSIHTLLYPYCSIDTMKNQEIRSTQPTDTYPSSPVTSSENNDTQSFRSLLLKAVPGHSLKEQRSRKALKPSYFRPSMARRAASAGATAAWPKTSAGCRRWNPHRDPGRCCCFLLRYLAHCLLRMSRSGSRGSFWWSWLPVRLVNMAKSCMWVGDGGRTWLGCRLLGMMMLAVAGCGFGDWFKVGRSRSVGLKGRLVVVKVLCSVALPSSMGSRCPCYIAMSQE